MSSLFLAYGDNTGAVFASDTSQLINDNREMMGGNEKIFKLGSGVLMGARGNANSILAVIQKINLMIKLGHLEDTFETIKKQLTAEFEKFSGFQNRPGGILLTVLNGEYIAESFFGFEPISEEEKTRIESESSGKLIPDWDQGVNDSPYEFTRLNNPPSGQFVIYSIPILLETDGREIMVQNFSKISLVDLAQLFIVKIAEKYKYCNSIPVIWTMGKGGDIIKL